MKRLCTLFILLAAIFHQSIAQDAFYIYRNDGGFNAFFFDEVDSMAYSKYDVDSLFHEEYVVQDVFTQDSIYRIPLAVIDSIGFVQQEPIYEDGAKPLSEMLMGYIDEVENLTITFKGEVPLSLMPKIGDKLITPYFSELFPCGFFGKVKLITADGGKFRVACDSLAIGDGIRQFYGCYRIDINSQNESANAKQRRAVDSMKELILGAFKKEVHIPFDLDLHTDLSLISFRADNLPVFKKKDIVGGLELGGKASITPNISGNVKIKMSFGKDEFKNILPCVKVHSTAFMQGQPEIQISAFVEGEAHPKIKEIPDAPLFGGLTWYCEPGVKVSGYGELGVVFQSTFKAKQVTEITIYPLLFPSLMPGAAAIPIPVHTVHPHKLEIIETPQYDWRYLAGSIEFKICPSFESGIGLGNHKIVKAGIEIALGPQFSIDFEHNAEEWDASDSNTNYYDMTKDSNKITIGTYLSGSIKIGGWDDRIEWNIIGGAWSLPWKYRKELHLLPSFEDVTITRNDTPSSIDVYAKVKDECLIPVTLGFALFDDKGVLQRIPYFKEDKPYYSTWFLPYSLYSYQDYDLHIDNIAPHKHYKVHPVVKLMGHTVLASPPAELKQVIPITITSVNTTSALYRPTDHPQHFEYKENPYEFKYNVATTVSLTDDTNVENWGYCYDGPDNYGISRISLKGAPYTYEDTRFPYYRNGSPTAHTARLYPFVKYSGDNEYYYGEPVDYPLVYPDTSTVELTGCSTNDVVTRENVEYNGVTYDYCSTFILDYNATGAYWITVGAVETGDGWSGWDNNLPARERAKAADGSNRLTINYYYNRKVLEGDYVLRLKGTDDQHGTSCTSSQSVRLIHNGKSFTGCELVQ